MMIVIDRISVVHIFMADTIKMVSRFDFSRRIVSRYERSEVNFKIHVLIYYFVSRFMHLSFFFLHEILSFAEKIFS